MGGRESGYLREKELQSLTLSSSFQHVHNPAIYIRASGEIENDYNMQAQNQKKVEPSLTL